MSKTRVNPQHRPATQADVLKATRRTTRNVITLMLYTMYTKCGATQTDLKAFFDLFNEVCDSVAKGYMTVEDAAAVLLEELEIDVHD